MDSIMNKTIKCFKCKHSYTIVLPDNWQSDDLVTCPNCDAEIPVYTKPR